LLCSLKGKSFIIVFFITKPGWFICRFFDTLSIADQNNCIWITFFKQAL